MPTAQAVATRPTASLPGYGFFDTVRPPSALEVLDRGIVLQQHLLGVWLDDGTCRVVTGEPVNRLPGRPLGHDEELHAILEAYAQSKLALTMWSCHVGRSAADEGPVYVAVNPGSMLGTKMVKEGFGVLGKDVRIGSGILVRAALSDDFAKAHGAYFDNDTGQFAPPHPDALDAPKCEALLAEIEELGESFRGARG